MKTMFIKTNLKKIVSLMLIIGLLTSTVFAVSYMRLGRTSTDLTVLDGDTFLHKAYCLNGNYYINVDPGGSSSVQRLSMVMRYEYSDTTITTGNFSYTTFPGWDPMSNTPRLVTTGDSGYETLESGYPYIKMENSTASAGDYLGSADINFGDFYFTNSFGISSSTLKFNYDTDNPTINASTIVGVAGGSNTLPNPYDYLLDIKFIPEPCVVDGNSPVGSDYSLTVAIVQRAAIDSGVNFRITEIEGAAESYAYVTGSPKEDLVVDPLTTAYLATGTFNQWGINTGSIRITLTYTGVARDTIDQRGTGIAIIKVFSGSDLVFNYLTGANTRTWNMNYLGAYISVLSGVLDAMPDFRKETQASVAYSGYDWATPLPNIVNASGTARETANLFSQSYSFNAGASNTPVSRFGAYSVTGSSSSDSTPAVTTRLVAPLQQISGSQDNFYFQFTDNWAGIATGSITMQVDVFTATDTLISSYQTGYTSPDDTYTFSGSELTLFGFAGSADYDDYTGSITLTNGLAALTTGDRVRMVLYAEDYVGNSVTKTGRFDMQDYPPKPYNKTITVWLENHDAVTDDKVSPIATTLLSGYYVAYQAAYGLLSGYTYSGATSAELTGINAGSTLTGVLLEDGLLTGYAHVDTGLLATKTYPFYIISENIYNQTGLITLNVNVEPGCGDAEGCGAKLWIYTGTTLSQAEANYPLTGLWYNGRFLKIQSSERPVLTGDADYAILFCGGSGALTSIDISNLDNYDNSPYSSLYTFSGSTLYVSGDNTYAMSGVIYQSGVIYVFRDLTGAIEYDTGAYAPYPQVNWTRDAVITGTITITGGYITGVNSSLFTLSGVELGGGKRIYTYAVTENTGLDLEFENRWNTSGETVEPAFYQTGLIDFNVGWIDRQASLLSGADTCQSPQTGILALTVTSTGYGADFANNGENRTYDTDDDDVVILEAISTGTTFTSFGQNDSDGAFTYDFNANSGTWLTGIDVIITGNRSGYIHFIDRAGNTGNVFVNTTCIQDPEVTVYAIPGYREYGNYDFSGNIQVFVLTGPQLDSGVLYSTYTGVFNTAGTGNFTLPRPLYGQSIGIVLQTTMHLPSLGFTGTFTETGIDFFDFTIWTGRDVINLTSGWFDAVDLSSFGLGIRSLLVPGDVYKENLGVTGSIINSFDMAVINSGLTVGGSSLNSEWDFDDNDGIISSFEQAVIIENLQRQGRDLDLDQFGGLNYVQ